MVHCERLAETCVGLHKDTRLTATRRVSNSFQKQMVKLYRADAKLRAAYSNFQFILSDSQSILKRLKVRILF